jgi:hypothetical protein
MPFVDDLLYFYNDVFIETGTFRGDTIDKVLNSEFNPKQIISLELSDVFYDNCKKRFENYENIKLFKANSKTDLYEIIKDVDTNITFWLDSHWSGVADVGCDAETLCPILYELEQIKNHKINTHTIMIDDIRLMDKIHFPVNLEEIIQKVIEINPNYTIKFFDDEYSKNDVLVAYIEEKKCFHKYLTKCKTNPQPPGFADFLRGTIALFEYAKVHNYKLYIDCDHPIFSYMKQNKNIISNKVKKDTIELLPPLSYDEIDRELNKLFSSGETFSVMTNAFYTKENGVLKNFGNISNDCKEFLKDILTPPLELNEKLDNVFKNVYNFDMGHNFKVVHLRCGDNFLNNNAYDESVYNKFYEKVSNLVNENQDNKYVLISDSSYIANKLKESIPNLYYWNNNKIHLGDLINDTQGVLDTLIDFFIMTISNEIISNGSGFSRIVSEIYTIKYNEI